MNIPSIVQNITPESSIAALSALESAFYANLRGGAKRSIYLYEEFRRTSMAFMHEIQSVFYLINAGAVIYGSKKILDNFKVALPSLGLSETWLILSFAVVAVVSPLFMILAAAVIYEYSKRPSFKWEMGHYLYTAKLVVTLSSLFFEKNIFLTLFTLGSTLYNFQKMRELKIIEVSVSKPRVEMTYRMAVLPYDPDEEENCGFCMTPLSHEGVMAFCANHGVHQECMRTWAVTKIANLNDSVKVHPLLIYDLSPRWYRIVLPQKGIPACLACTSFWPQHRVTMKVNGSDDVEVVIKGLNQNQHFFEIIQTLYTLMKGGLTYLQGYPELTASIYALQKWLIISDLLALGQTGYFLLDQVDQAYGKNHKGLVSIGSIVAAVATLALSSFALTWLNGYLAPALLLKEGMCWNPPFYHKIIQIISLNQIVATAALSLFSNQKRLNLFNLAAQVANIGLLFGLPWIEITRVINRPAIAELRYVKQLTIYSYYMVPAKEQIESTLQALYDYSGKILENSEWKKDNGSPGGYIVNIALKQLLNTPLTDVVMSIVNRSTSVNLIFNSKFERTFAL